ncbi:AAA family ATPase [Natronosporangium hydrolyticum]|uniref:AAA family ATPase n=1 Tax=Natronosporangium hydrolyticum TaxID=2811111 RepID=A0A895YIY0_9ACTN|nr:adenylate/guanylate cyclase domain-containing protein [Natronosporangium hydrolyticum]QSB14546.1 AAA family ATPase [Natronosporangium hydrolyticum]
MTCAVCGTVAVLGARFCHQCGSALPDAASLPLTERRVVTVLFGDLSDFTSWSEDQDPERVGAVVDRVLAALAGAVRTFGGHVDKLTGDGIMAVFGAPVAHEDDAERAVRAALAMQRSVRRVLDDERGGGAPLGLRVGINTGAVVAGVQASLDYTVIGDTVNTAARLADAAAIGTVYAGARTSATTRNLASWRQLRPLRLRGKREPVEAYELLGLHDAPGTRTAFGDEAPFVGREVELARVAGRLAEVVDRGDPRVLVMTAEAGVGKTRFAAEAARGAVDYATPARVLSVRCAAYGERRRFAPLADLVRAAIGLATDGAASRSVVEQRLRRLAARLDTPLHVEALLAMLGHGELPDPLSGAWAGAEGLDAAALPAAVAGLFTGLARNEPLLVIIDDLHDATTETMEALGATLSRVRGPVLTLLLGRPELVRTSGALTAVPDAEVTTLPPLRGADVARLLGSYLAGGRLEQSDEDQLLATAQGNPFYLAELVTLLIERGALTRVSRRGDEPGPTRWRLATGSLGARLLSRDLAAVLAARIDALPPEARSVLRDAAVVGATVPGGSITALAERRTGRDGRPAAVAAVELDRAIDELLHRRMLRRTRDGYGFATPLLREAAYAGLGKADLAERHAFLARWGAKSGLAEPERDEFVARHVERAATLADLVGLAPDANPRLVVPLGVAALTAAARRSVGVGEPALAVDFAQRATRLAGADLPPPDRLVHARALLQHGQLAEARELAEKVYANAGDAPAIRANALIVAGTAHRSLGDHPRSLQVWREALQIATDAGLTTEQADALRRLGMADYLSGRVAEAAQRFTEAYEIAVRADDPRSQAWSLHHLAWVSTSRGDFAGADAALGRAARLFAEQRDPFGRTWLRGTTAFNRLLAGRLAEAKRLARTFLPFGERVGEAWAVGTLRAVSAFASAELGELGEADRLARRAYRDFAAADDDWGRGLALVVRGVVARGLGEAEHAADLLDDAREYCERAGHPLLIGVARTVRGLVALESGDPATAIAQAEAVQAIVEPHGVLEPALVGPQALLGAARLATGEYPAALAVLAPLAAAAQAPSLVFPRRQAVALYAAALLADGEADEAVVWAERAQEVPAQDVRSRVFSARVLAQALAATGARERARVAAREAAQLAYATAQVSERAAADAVLAELA